MSTSFTDAVNSDVSVIRLSLVRLLFLGNFVGLALYVLPQMIARAGSWDPLRGVAFSCWATLSLMSALGIRHPLKMLPILLFQLVYKSIWLLAVYWPGTATTTALMPVMLGGLIADVVVIPWPYFVAHFVRARGDRWSEPIVS